MNEALSHQFEETLSKKYEEQREKERSEERQKMVEWKEKLEAEARLKSKKEIEDLRLKIKEEEGEETKLLREELSKQKEEAQKAKNQELLLRKKANALEEREKNFELEKMRQLDEERTKIQENAEKRVKDEYQLTIVEKDKLARDLLKQIEELKQKATQGSQQTQGEVMELELERVLKQSFPIDEVREVGKGKRGADIVQVVKDSIGRESGQIIWESKRTKNWEKDWTLKLKEDLREIKGDVAILVSQVLPDGIRTFGFLDGVVVCSFDCFLEVAQMIRKSLIELSNAKQLSQGKNERVESLYKYITSSEFAQKIESMLDTYLRMNQTLEREKMVTQKIWAEREKQIERLKQNTLSIHGSFSGLIEETLEEVKSLEFSEIEITLED